MNSVILTNQTNQDVAIKIYMKKLLKVFLKALGLLLVLIVFVSFIFDKINPYPNQIKYGVTFSPSYAGYLKLDWRSTYLQILDGLKVKNLRIPTYWDVAEAIRGRYDFGQTDYLLDEAGKRGVKVMLILGMRQPRWPECQIPAWAKNLTVVGRQQQVLEFIQKTVERYKDRPEIWAWQVENEPFVSWFGESCDPPDKKFLQAEVMMVKKLDSRPVVITDSGEWSSWISAMRSSDILGISVYRKAHNQLLHSYITYPFPALMYPLKSTLARLLAPQNQKTIISELQVEPWLQTGALDTSLEEQLKLFSLTDFKNNIEYAKKIGFDEIYLWGVEWWYFMAERGHPEYLEYAGSLFR